MIKFSQHRATIHWFNEEYREIICTLTDPGFGKRGVWGACPPENGLNLKRSTIKY